MSAKREPYPQITQITQIETRNVTDKKESVAVLTHKSTAFVFANLCNLRNLRIAKINHYFPMVT